MSLVIPVSVSEGWEAPSLSCSYSSSLSHLAFPFLVHTVPPPEEHSRISPHTAAKQLSARQLGKRFLDACSLVRLLSTRQRVIYTRVFICLPGFLTYVRMYAPCKTSNGISVQMYYYAGP